MHLRISSSFWPKQYKSPLISYNWTATDLMLPVFAFSVVCSQVRFHSFSQLFYHKRLLRVIFIYFHIFTWSEISFAFINNFERRKTAFETCATFSRILSIFPGLDLSSDFLRKATVQKTNKSLKIFPAFLKLK